MCPKQEGRPLVHLTATYLCGSWGNAKSCESKRIPTNLLGFTQNIICVKNIRCLVYNRFMHLEWLLNSTIHKGSVKTFKHIFKNLDFATISYWWSELKNTAGKCNGLLTFFIFLFLSSVYIPLLGLAWQESKRYNASALNTHACNTWNKLFRRR